MRLTALQHPLVLDILQQHQTVVLDLVQGLGSPLHLMFPQIFAENIQRFKQVLTDFGLQADILYAKKANKADCLMRVCVEQDIGVDVASSGELSRALSAGVKGDRIGISGAHKDRALLQVALQQSCLIAVDSLSELAYLIDLANTSQQQGRILLRYFPPHQNTSRFGLTDREIQQALALCCKHATQVKLEGFSFHLTGYDISERAINADLLIDLCVKAQQLGLSACHRVNIGGGFAVQYVETLDWQQFLAQNKDKHYHANKQFFDFYPYGSTVHGAAALHQLLSYPVTEQYNLAKKCQQNQIQLLLEPGRALLDQAGISAFKVQGIKHGSHRDYVIVTVAGSSFNLSEQWFNSEYLPDPVVLTHTPRQSAQFKACVAGATCLESDLLTWRKIDFEHQIAIGDVCIYLNTAGYQMDSNESAFHEAPIPHKVVLELMQNQPTWYIDQRSLYMDTTRSLASHHKVPL
ncbi:hypothetical protein [Acinetobacter sp. ESBL14]|uniref:hypothetical protein n=1 Tax=Acinetobacter sp. ESBL14 TaxID=3077329 RepID=UPI002FCBB01F